VANLTRADGAAFFGLVGEGQVATVPVAFPLTEANQALAALREGRLDGAAVLVP
jgi:propanol-preferring alcohol dehydrogenase